jgi:hypothetical protein
VCARVAALRPLPHPKHRASRNIEPPAAQEIERRYVALAGENERLRADAAAAQKGLEEMSLVRAARQGLGGGLEALAAGAVWAIRGRGRRPQQRARRGLTCAAPGRPRVRPLAQELRQERAARERLVSDSAGRDAAHAQSRGQVAALSAERNALAGLVDGLKGQLAAKGAELAAQLEAAAGLAAEKAAAEARAREADRAKTRLELDVAQLKEQVASLNEQLGTANDALEAKAADLLALQRASGEGALKLQREAADLQAALADARRAEEAAARRAAGAEERLAASAARQAEVEANAAELEASLGGQLRAALAQAERYQALAAAEAGRREEVGGGQGLNGFCWGGGSQ